MLVKPVSAPPIEVVVLVVSLPAHKLAIALRKRDNLVGGGKFEGAALGLGSIPFHAIAGRELAKFATVAQLRLVCRIPEFSCSPLTTPVSWM